jgi:hypothetical protein
MIRVSKLLFSNLIRCCCISSLFYLPIFVSAEEKEEEAEQAVSRMKQRLHLNQEQSEEIASIYQEARSACKALPERKTRLQCMKEHQPNIRAKLKQVLNPEQLKKLEASRMQMKADRPKEHEKGPQKPS